MKLDKHKIYKYIHESKKSHLPFGIIIPYRDNIKQNRKEQLDKIIKHFNDVLPKYTDNYRIIIIEQSNDGRKFNRGALLNIGHIIAKKKNLQYVIFHDVDTYPNEDVIEWYLHYPYNPLHMGHLVDKYKTLNVFLGAVLSVSLKHNEMINGFSNCFWGWGGEDDSYLRRLLKYNIIINRPSKGTFDTMEHAFDDSNKIEKHEKHELIDSSLKNINNDGINSISYNIIEKQEINSHTKKYTVQLDDKCMNDYDIPDIISFDDIDKCILNISSDINIYLRKILTNKTDIFNFFTKINNQYPSSIKHVTIENYNERIDKYLTEMKSHYNIPSITDIENYNVARNDTFEYIYNVVYKGVYVKIQNNKIISYKLFMNDKPLNNWGKNLVLPNNYFNKNSKIVNDPSKWMANNCLPDHEIGSSIYPSVIYEFLFLLHQTLKNHQVKDCEFFYNKRDFPSIRKDFKHPFNMLFKQNEAEQFDKPKYMLPIMGASSGDDFMNILMPTPDDVHMVYQSYFPTTCENSYFKIIKDNVKWKDKISTALFRGKATGCGTIINTNQRLHLAHMSHLWKNDNNYNNNNKIDGIAYLNAGITSWNKRDKIYYGKLYNLNNKNLSFDKAEFMTREEQYKYKYIISVDGHARPFRVPFELGTNSLVLLVDSLNNYTCWWSHLIEPYIHYIPIKADLSDLAEKITWCKTHDEECEKISVNATMWYNQFMNNEGLTKYVSHVLNSLF
jgi:hypothetical protein